MKAEEANKRFAALCEFTNALGQVVETSDTVRDLNGNERPILRPKPGTEQQWNEAVLRLEALSHKAGRAFDAAGVWVDHSPPGTMATRRVNPALIWRVCFEADDWFPLGMLQQLIVRAGGALEDLRDDPPSPAPRVSLSGYSFAGWWAAVAYTAVGGLITALVIFLVTQAF